MGGLDKGLMRGRLGVYYGTSSNTESSVEGVNHQDARLEAHGGDLQQMRMIRDKRRSLDRALWNSYQGANVKLIDSNQIARALINPNKLKPDYDDKILSIGFEYGYKPGDIKVETRIYQNDEILVDQPGADIILPIMDNIVHKDKLINGYSAGGFKAWEEN